MDWATDSRDWPNRQYSRFVRTDTVNFHIQEMGEGAVLLFLHGAGASTHTWRAILPDLARDHRVIAVDLPGQGFSQIETRRHCGLEPMSRALTALLAVLDLHPCAIIGHSAGVAIALRLAAILDPRPKAIVAINGALRNFPGSAGVVFPILARMLSANPLTSFTLSQLAAMSGSVQRVIESTGSRLDKEGLGLYRRLLADRKHVAATLAMMAQWDLDNVLENYAADPVATLFLAGDQDGAVPAETSKRAARLVPDAEIDVVPDAGHLLHEERPGFVADHIRAFVRLPCATETAG